MVTIYVNGERIDTLRDTQMAFKWQSSYFSFDDLQISRTQEFTLPRTPRNERIMAFAGEVQQGGQMMMQTLQAVAVVEGIQITGTLVIGEVTPSGYKAVLTYGNLAKLAEIKAASNIGDYLQLSDSIVMDGTLVSPLANLNFARYDNGSGSLTAMRFPSVSVEYLMQQCEAYFGVNVSGIDAGTLRIVLNTLNADGYQIGSNTVTLGTDGAMTGYDANFFRPTQVTVENEQYQVTRTIPALKVTTPVKMRITGDNTYTPDPFYGFMYNCLIIMFNGSAEWNIFKGQTIDTEVELRDGAVIMFASQRRGVTAAGAVYYYYDDYITSVAKTFTMTLTGVGGTTAWGEMYYLQPNLPQVTYMDLLKSVAAITNKYITYDAATNTIQGVSLDALAAASVNIDARFIAEEKLERKVGKWMQDNVIVYDELEGTGESVRNYTEKHYIVQNTTLEKRKELLKHKFAQGGQTSNTTLQQSYPTILRIVSTELKEDTGNQTTEALKGFAKPVLAQGNTYQLGKQTLTLIKAVKSSKVQDICDRCTHYVCKVQMPLYEFIGISEQTVYNLKGCDWVVESAEWAKGVARLYLQRVR